MNEAGEGWLKMDPLSRRLRCTPDHFAVTERDGQTALEFLPDVSFAEVRLFMRGRLLDASGGRAGIIRERLTPWLGEPLPLVAPHQVHGVSILDSVPENVLPLTPKADGVLLTSPGLEASLRFADCAPVVVMPSGEWAAAGTPWVLLMHSGYKGTVQNIVRAGLDEVARRFGADAVRSSSAWVGPCIGGGNYPRTMEEWTARGLEAFRAENVCEMEGHFYFDIAGELRLQLMESGIDQDRIFVSCLDTFERREVCYSYRGGDREDRMFLHARLRPA